MAKTTVAQLYLISRAALDPMRPWAGSFVPVQRVRRAERRPNACTKWTDHGLVFSTIRGGHIGKDQVASVLKAECVNLGLKLLTPHGLRHLCASLLLSENVPLPNVSKRLGHADPSITARIYSHVVKPDYESADTLQRLVGGGNRTAAAARLTSRRD